MIKIIEIPGEIINNMFINAVYDNGKEEVFLVMRKIKENMGEEPILYGYTLDLIIKNPRVLIADPSLQDRLHFNRIKECRFITKEKKSEFLYSIQKNFGDFQKKHLLALLDEMNTIQDFILSIDDRTPKERNLDFFKKSSS